VVLFFILISLPFSCEVEFLCLLPCSFMPRRVPAASGGKDRLVPFAFFFPPGFVPLMLQPRSPLAEIRFTLLQFVLFHPGDASLCPEVYFAATTLPSSFYPLLPSCLSPDLCILCSVGFLGACSRFSPLSQDPGCVFLFSGRFCFPRRSCRRSPRSVLV